MGDAHILNWIIQGGSFGLIVAGCYFCAKVLFPRVIATVEAQQNKFDQILERQEKRHEREMEKRDASFEKVATALECISDSVRDMATRLDRLENQTAEHRPLPPDKPAR